MSRIDNLLSRVFSLLDDILDGGLEYFPLGDNGFRQDSLKTWMNGKSSKVDNVFTCPEKVGYLFAAR